MLDAFIIEEIKRREEDEERRRERERPRLEIPIAPERPVAPGGEEKPADRGVVIIDYSVEPPADETADEPEEDEGVDDLPYVIDRNSRVLPIA